MKARLAGFVLFVLLTSPLSATRAASPADPKLSNTATLIFAGKVAEARTLLTEAREAYRADGDVIGEGVALFLLALADVAAEERTSARTKLNSASSRLTGAGDGLAAWMVRTALPTSNGAPATSRWRWKSTK
ncbi:MAG TPA: hypothetical protein VF111_02450 [Thermoanaerobaculia bacterium]